MSEKADMSTQAETTAARRGFRKTREGLVVSDKMDKTVVVAVERQVRHAVYGKSQKKTSKFVAHNDGNEAKVGDTVAIAESRPLSRRKRWIVTRVVAKRQEI